MSTRRSITLFALNVVIHDVNKRDYAGLLKDAGLLNMVVNFNKTHAATLGPLTELEYGGVDFLIGNMFKFINIAPPYFDINKVEILYDEDGNPKELIPRHIKGTANIVLFTLDTNKHRIFVDRKYISPSMAKTFFDVLFTNEKIIDKYGAIDVTVHSSKNAVDEMIENKFVRKIDVKLFRPNPIGGNRFDEEILEELERQNAETMHIGLGSQKEYLAPNAQFQKYMYAATSNGNVVATAIDENDKSVTLSTEAKPIVHKDTIDKREPFYNSLCRSALTLWDKILNDGQ